MKVSIEYSERTFEAEIVSLDSVTEGKNFLGVWYELDGRKVYANFPIRNITNWYVIGGPEVSANNDELNN